MKACLGFSLIEVLIATLLSAILGVIIFTAYNQVNRITRSIDNYVDAYSKEALLQNLLTKDISGAFIPIQAHEKANGKEKLLQQIFVYEQEAELLKSFTFITNNPITAYGTAKPRIARVRYTLKEEEKQQPGEASYLLLRQESDTLDINEFTKADSPIRAYEVVNGIKKISFTFTRMIKKEEKIEPEVRPVWRSENNGKEKEKNDQPPEILLPQLATFTIILWDNERKRERQFSGSIVIATMIDAQAQESEDAATKKKVTLPKEPQQSPQRQTPKEEPKNIGQMIQEAMGSARQERKTEVVVIQGHDAKKPMKTRSPSLITQLGGQHAT